MIGEDLTGRRHGRSTKNAAAGQRAQNHATRGKEKRQAMRGASRRCPARQPERPISKTATLTARRGNKGSDTLPPNQQRHPKSRFCFWRITCDRDTRQRTDKSSAHDRRDFVSCPVGDDERHDVRSGHPIKFIHVRSGRRDGRRHEPSNFR